MILTIHGTDARGNPVTQTVDTDDPVTKAVREATAPLRAEVDVLKKELAALKAQGEPLAKLDISSLAKVDALEKLDARVKVIEAQPSEGGPRRAIYPVTKGGESGDGDGDLMAKAKERDALLVEMLAKTTNPYEIEKLTQERALLSFKTGI